MGFDISECQLCKKHICRGKVLDCDHAFCTTCLQKYYVLKNMLDIICPVSQCQRLTMLPTGIIGDLEDYRDGLSADSTHGRSPGGSTPPVAGIWPYLDAPRATTPPLVAVTRPKLMRSFSEQPASRSCKGLVRQGSILNEVQQEALRRKMNNMAIRSISLPAPSMESINSNVSNSSRKLTRQKSVLSTDAQKEALRRMMEKEPHLLQPKVLTTPPIREEPKKCTGFTTRRSKLKQEAETRKRAILGGGFASMMKGIRASELDIRESREGPWGYDNIHEWGGRQWGMVTHD